MPNDGNSQHESFFVELDVKTKRVALLAAVFLPETDDGRLVAPSRSPMAEVGAGFGTAEVVGRVVGGLHRRRSLGFCRRPLVFWSAAWSLCPGLLRQGPLTAWRPDGGAIKTKNKTKRFQ